jgi:hypothetical protein
MWIVVDVSKPSRCLDQTDLRMGERAGHVSLPGPPFNDCCNLLAHGLIVGVELCLCLLFVLVLSAYLGDPVHARQGASTKSCRRQPRRKESHGRSSTEEWFWKRLPSLQVTASGQEPPLNFKMLLDWWVAHARLMNWFATLGHKRADLDASDEASRTGHRVTSNWSHAQ